MLRLVLAFTVAAMCAGQKSSDLVGASEWITSAGSVELRNPLPVHMIKEEGAIMTSNLGSEILQFPASSGSLDIRSPLPVEVAQEGGAVLTAHLGSETMEYPSPALLASAPLVNLPKGAQEVVDVPHADIRLPGNSIQNKDLHLNLPTPVVEAPKPIIQEKEVLFRLPQPVFYIPKPIVQHKPIVYKVPHTLRTVTPQVNLREYLFKVPSAQITGKSAYAQAIPREI